MKNKTIEKFPLGEIAKIKDSRKEGLQPNNIFSGLRFHITKPLETTPVSGVYEVNNYDKKRNSDPKKES